MSNLLKDASILLTPTAYNNGRMLAVKPSDNLYGTEEITNGDFSNGINGWQGTDGASLLSVVLGELKIENGDGSAAGANSSITTEIGKKYRITFVSNKGSAINGIFFGAGTSTNSANLLNVTDNFDGIHTGTFTATTTTTWFIAKTLSVVNGQFSYIDNVSVKEDLSGDFQFSRNSAATRVNAQGLVENVQILSSNLVSNGDFSQEGSEVITNGDFSNGLTDWIVDDGTSWTNVNNRAFCDGNNGLIKQGFTSVLNKTYKVTFDVVNVGGGELGARIGGGTYAWNNYPSGSYVRYLVSGSSSEGVLFYAVNGWSGSIDNISVKEVGQDWTLGTGWSIGDGKANCDGTDGAQIRTDNSPLTNGKTYYISFQITDYTSGDIRLLGQSFYGISGNSVTTVTGTFVATKPYVRFYSQVFIGSITNISVIEITDDTNLPRINYEGFSYQDSLGSELIVNGDFDVNGNWTNFGTPLVSEQSSTRYYTSPFSWYVKGDAFRQGIFSPNNFTLTNGKTYNVSLWVYALDGAEILSGLTNTDKSVFTSHAVTQNEWTNITYSAIANATSASYISILTSSSTLEFYVDNVSVKEYLGQEVVPNSGCGSWLLEPQSTNLNTLSNPTDAQKGSTSYASITFQDNFNWGLGSIINNAIVFVDNSTTRYAYYNSTVVSGTEYTLSVFIKMDDNSVPIPATDFLMVLAGTSFASGYNVESYGNNVYRVSVTGTAGGSNTANGILKVASNSAKGFKISAFQIEQQSYATSYIPTQGASSTRLADIATNSGNASLINSEEGTLYFEGSFKENATNQQLTLSNGTTAERIVLEVRNSGQLLRFNVRSSGVNSVEIDQAITVNTPYKLGLLWSGSVAKFYLNGSLIGSNSSVTSPTGLDSISFDSGTNVLPFYGKTKALAVYKTALTDEQLTLLTTI